jgi:hypothetical protein
MRRAGGCKLLASQDAITVAIERCEGGRCLCDFIGGQFAVVIRVEGADEGRKLMARALGPLGAFRMAGSGAIPITGLPVD